MTATPTPTSPVEVSPTTEDWALANACIPAAVIFADDPTHVQDLRRRAAEHIARRRLASPVVGVEEMREACAKVAEDEGPIWGGPGEYYGYAAKLRTGIATAIRTLPLPAAPSAGEGASDARHRAHCNRADCETEGVCKYGAPDCPMLPTTDAPASPAGEPWAWGWYERGGKKMAYGYLPTVNYPRDPECDPFPLYRSTPTTNPERSSEVEREVWQSMSIAPKDGTPILAWFWSALASSAYGWADTIRWHNGTWWDDRDGPCQPVAWMRRPSPPPPADDGGRDQRAVDAALDAEWATDAGGDIPARGPTYSIREVMEAFGSLSTREIENAMMTALKAAANPQQADCSEEIICDRDGPR